MAAILVFIVVGAGDLRRYRTEEAVRRRRCSLTGRRAAVPQTACRRCSW
ncbi:hypothetical protein ACPA9J_05415 [Pseudomonas aeruginosa]